MSDSPKPPLIDPAAARELFALARNAAGKNLLVTRFGDEATSLLRAAQLAHATRNDATVRAVLHRLKGAAGAVGATRLMQAVQRVEHTPLELETGFVTLQSLIEKSCAALHQAHKVTR